jgi:hypothetical protein
MQLNKVVIEQRNEIASTVYGVDNTAEIVGNFGDF